MRFDLAKKLAKGSKSNIPPVDDVLSEKCFKGLPLKFHGESNGTKKFLDIQFSICITPEVEPEVTSLTLEIDYLKD